MLNDKSTLQKRTLYEFASQILFYYSMLPDHPGGWSLQLLAANGIPARGYLTHRKNDRGKIRYVRINYLFAGTISSQYPSGSVMK